MTKKIYDIVPPKVANKLENTLKDLSVKDKKKRSYQKKSTTKPKKRFPLIELLVGGGIIVILIAVYFYNTLPKSEIEIWPRTEVLSFEEQITLNKSVSSVDIVQKVIPAQYFEEQLDESEEFLATGTASNEGKASGTIKIYNKIDPAVPLTLIKGTHFLSDSGKYFVTLDKVTIPAAQYQKGKLIAGSVDVKIQAKESGEDYNIGASKFSVPKLAGTSYYYTIYAESTNDMQGGYKGQVKKVTKNDIENAEDALTENLLEKAETLLRGKLSEGQVLLDSALEKNVIQVSSNVKPEAIGDKFNSQAKVKVSALVFEKQDLEEIAKYNILSQLTESKTFLNRSLEMAYIQELIDAEKGSGTMKVQVSVKTHQIINANDFIDLLDLKSADGVKDAINQMYDGEISEIKVNFWPFWVNKIPKDKDRVKINLNF